MKSTLVILSLFLAFVGCSSKQLATNKGTYVEQVLFAEDIFTISEYATDSEYGYTEEKPIMVGGVRDSEGPLNERRFLNALVGPNREFITYKRLGSCCTFRTKNNAMENMGLLDKYEIMYDGLKEPIILYINMYDSEVLKVPVGFKLIYEDDAKNDDSGFTTAL